MEIPIVVIYGYRTSFDRLGWTARLCSRCRKVQPFECFDKLRSNHVYFIYGKEKSVELLLICDFCETSVGISPRSKEAKALAVERNWTKADGLQVLVEKTNPQLRRVAVSDKPSLRELFALLESVNERSSPYKVDAQKGFTKGALIGVPALAALLVLLGAVGLPLFGLDALGCGFLGAFFGLFVGGTIGAIKFKFDYSKQLAEEILVSSIQRKSLSLGELQRALKHYPNNLKYVASGLTRLASGA